MMAGGVRSIKSILQFVRELYDAHLKPGACVVRNKPIGGSAKRDTRKSIHAIFIDDSIQNDRYFNVAHRYGEPMGKFTGLFKLVTLGYSLAKFAKKKELVRGLNTLN